MKFTKPKGTRDFGSVEMAKRNYIFDTVKTVFQKFGFVQIETPAMENLSTLTGKYGEEGDRLVFKILNSGDYLKKVDEQILIAKDSKKTSFQIAEKALKYDLTIPFARFAVEHRNELQLPFKRFQIQPVWRADRPQKGRYREFFQCDADVIGSNALMFEVEFVQIFQEVLSKLKLDDFKIKLNNRKILAGIAESIGVEEKLTDLTISIDKLDKIGVSGVKEELKKRGCDADAINKLNPLFEISGSINQKIEVIANMLSDSQTGMLGIAELKEVLESSRMLGVEEQHIDFDPTLARGLDYYTGIIFEVIAENSAIGSICGGGRYDDLTGIFGWEGVSGVGISFGADRIYDILEVRDLYPETIQKSVQLMVVNFGEEKEKYGMKLVKDLRSAGVSCELYHKSAKMKNQMKYANNKNIPFVVMAGEEEIKQNLVTIKNMESGEQTKLSREELLAKMIS